MMDNILILWFPSTFNPLPPSKTQKENTKTISYSTTLPAPSLSWLALPLLACTVTIRRQLSPSVGLVLYTGQTKDWQIHSDLVENWEAIREVRGGWFSFPFSSLSTLVRMQFAGPLAGPWRRKIKEKWTENQDEYCKRKQINWEI